MKELSREQWFEYIEQNDSYPKHSHQWIVECKVGNPGRLYRTYGPFISQEIAKEWVQAYKVKYTTKGFITSWKILPLCEVLPIGEIETQVVRELSRIHNNLIENQVELDTKFEQTIRENLWELYD